MLCDFGDRDSYGSDWGGSPYDKRFTYCRICECWFSDDSEGWEDQLCQKCYEALDYMREQGENEK